MSTQTYQCGACGEQFEIYAENIQEGARVECPSCYSLDTQKKTNFIDLFFSIFNGREESQEENCGGEKGCFT